MWAMRTASKAVPLYICPTSTTSSPGETDISDIQLLQWYSQRRDIRRNPLPYSVVKDAVMDLLANRETPATKSETAQLLITPVVTNEGVTIEPLTPAVIQHAVPAIDLQTTSREQLFCPSRHQQASDATAETEQRQHSINPTISAQ